MKISFVILLAVLVSGSALAQTLSPEEENIKETIIELFDAYRDGDSSRVAATFTSSAILQTVHKDKEGNVVLSEAMPASRLINYVGGGLSEVHDERLWDIRIAYDDLMATVWTKYAFFLGKKFMHCGTEVLNLHKVEGEWKIFYLADTRQQEDCDVPASVK